MIIFYIIETYWDGNRYSNPDVYLFSTKEKRDAALERFENSQGYRKGDIDLEWGESKVDEEIYIKGGNK